MRKLSKGKRKKIFNYLLCAGIMLGSFPVAPVYATSGNAIITNGFSNLQSIVTAFVSSIGSIVVLWGLFEWGNSVQSQDGMMQTQAFKRIGGGLVMTLGPQLLPLLLGS